MDIYLSLTTRPERLASEHFKKVYTSLLTQLVPFKKLIINLSIKEFTYYIPSYLRNDSVILNETDICGPCAKLLGGLNCIPDDALIIVMDDDIVMRNTFIKSLYESYLINPTKVSTHTTFVSKLNYNEVCGFSGYIVNINLIRNIIQFYSTMPECCRTIDDNWISWCLHKMNIEVVPTIERNAWNAILDIPNTDPHPNWHELCKHSNQKQKIQEMYSILESR
jgi:hypothetical protein